MCCGPSLPLSRCELTCLPLGFPAACPVSTTWVGACSGHGSCFAEHEGVGGGCECGDGWGGGACAAPVLPVVPCVVDSGAAMAAQLTNNYANQLQPYACLDVACSKAVTCTEKIAPGGKVELKVPPQTLAIRTEFCSPANAKVSNQCSPSLSIPHLLDKATGAWNPPLSNPVTQQAFCPSTPQNSNLCPPVRAKGGGRTRCCLLPAPLTVGCPRLPCVCLCAVQHQVCLPSNHTLHPVTPLNPAWDVCIGEDHDHRAATNHAV